MAALSVQYSKAGIKVFQPFFFPASSNAFRKLLLAETPPARQMSVMPVSDEDAIETARRLAREEGIFAGTSTGANVVAALRVAERLDPQKTVATIIVDSGLRYLTTDLYRMS